MPSQSSRQLYLLYIPNLHISVLRPQRNQGLLHRAGHRSRDILDPQVAKLGNPRIGGIPKIDARRQPYNQAIIGRPIDEIEVEVVLQCWSIQNLHWQFVDLASAALEGCQFMPDL